MIIWNPTIPPFRSLLVWKFLQNKGPTDKNWRVRGCHMVFIWRI